MESSLLTKNLNKTVEESIKEDGVWIFSNPKCKADKKVYYTWTSLFQAFQDKEFVVLLQNDVSTELSKLDLQEYHQIRAAQSYSQDPYFTMSGCCRMDYKKDRSILNVEGKVVANYKPSMINQIYHLKEATAKVSSDWLKQKK